MRIGRYEPPQNPLTTGTKVKRGLLVLAILIAVPLLSYFLVIRPLQIRHQREDFKKAEAIILNAEKKIELLAGGDHQSGVEKSCTYSSAVYTKGRRTCSIYAALGYYTPSSREAAALIEKISKGFGTELRIYDKGPVKDIGSVNFDQDELIQDLPSVGKLNCGISYTYPKERYEHKFIDDAISPSMIVVIGCGGDSMAEFYPVLEK